MANFEPLPTFPEGSNDRPSRVEPDYASWIRRVVAFLLDGALVFAVATGIAVATGHHDVFNTFKIHLVNGRQMLRPYGSELNFFLITQGVLSFAYSSGFLASRWPATLGMRLLSIQIARESDLGTVSVGWAVGRTALFVGVSTVLQGGLRVVSGLVVLLDLLWPLWDPRNQTLHDKVARTVVVRRTAGH